MFTLFLVHVDVYIAVAKVRRWWCNIASKDSYKWFILSFTLYIVWLSFEPNAISSIFFKTYNCFDFSAEMCFQFPIIIGKDSIKRFF